MTRRPRLLATGGLAVVVGILVVTLLLSLDHDWVSIGVLSVWLTTTAVVGTTMQPAHASIWLRQETAS